MNYQMLESVKSRLIKGLNKHSKSRSMTMVKIYNEGKIKNIYTLGNENKIKGKVFNTQGYKVTLK